MPARGKKRVSQGTWKHHKSPDSIVKQRNNEHFIKPRELYIPESCSAQLRRKFAKSHEKILHFWKNDLQTRCRCCSGTDVSAQLQQPRCPSDHVSPLLFTTKSPCSLTRTQEWLSEITHVIRWRFKSKQRSEIHPLNLDWLPEESNEEEETPGWIMWTLKAQIPFSSGSLFSLFIHLFMKNKYKIYRYIYKIYFSLLFQTF